MRCSPSPSNDARRRAASCRRHPRPRRLEAPATEEHQGLRRPADPALSAAGRSSKRALRPHLRVERRRGDPGHRTRLGRLRDPGGRPSSRTTRPPPPRRCATRSSHLASHGVESSSPAACTRARRSCCPPTSTTRSTSCTAARRTTCSRSRRTRRRRRMLRMHEGMVSSVWPEFDGVRNQDLELRFHDGGQWYLGRRERLDVGAAHLRQTARPGSCSRAGAASTSTRSTTGRSPRRSTRRR
jgi:hypothetical protein